MGKAIKSYSAEELSALMTEYGQPSFRTTQLIEWLYRENVSSYQEMTNLPKTLRDRLENEHPLWVPRVINKQVSVDGTRKYVLEFADGELAESVAIPSSGRQGQKTESTTDEDPFFKTAVLPEEKDTEVPTGRLTACLSTQIGCPMNCTFCATGQAGFSRNLLPGEIVDQVHAIQRDFGSRVSNLVLMGQGEAFLNYDNTLSALRLINSPHGLMIGARHITISTCGVLSGIKRLAREPEQFTLAVSLHSAEQKIRDELMPGSKGDSLPKLKKSLLDYVRESGRRVSLEYLLIRNVNDGDAALSALISFCKGLLCHVNLLAINPVSANEYQPSSNATMEKWRRALDTALIPTTIRNSRGVDIEGACGQLKNSISGQL